MILFLDCILSFRIQYQESDEGKYYPNLFERALKENRPVFVDYFLRRYHNPLNTTAFIQYNESIQASAPSYSRRSMQISSPAYLTTEDEMRVKYALKFILVDLYQNNPNVPSDVRYN